MDESEVITMIVKSIEEHEDGSATVVFDFSAGDVQKLLQYAVLDILTKATKESA